MGLGTWLRDKFKNKKKENSGLLIGKNVSLDFKNAIFALNDENIAFKQAENLVWYNGDPDYIMSFYTKVLVDYGPMQITPGQFRKNYENYYWTLASKESGVKRTHSGLPKVIIDTPIKCLGSANIKVLSDRAIDDAKTNLVDKILDENEFNSTMTKQLTMDLVVGDGVYIISIDKEKSDYPIIEYIDGRDCAFEYTGDRVTGVIISKRYLVDGDIYECFERRSTKRIQAEDGTYKRVATIEYQLFLNDTKKGYQPVGLDAIEQTKDLTNLQFNNIPFMLAVPCIRKMDPDTKRGESLYKGKIDLFDDFDQNISQEANIMRAITPIEFVDSNLLDHDKDGNVITPSAFGKQFVLYKGAASFDQVSKGIEDVFHDVDFNKITSESLETLNRCLSGIVSPATLGLELARNSTDLSQREKEKVTLQTVKELKEYEIDVLEKLFNRTLALYDIMIDKDIVPENYEISVSFKDYANPTLDAKINAFSPALVQGAISIDRYVEELYGDESKETKDKEKAYIEEFFNKTNVSDLNGLFDE